MSIQGNWDRRISRRSFIGLGGMSAVALALGGRSTQARQGGSAGFGSLAEDPGGILDLPRGFQYRIVSEQGTNLSSGKPVPGDHDGMAAFRGPKNTTILVRNHELSPGDLAGGDAPVVGENPYDPAQPGGTTGIVIGPDHKEIRDYVTSSGTNRNCSGGPTPWGTWITCEETRIRAGEGEATNTAHGYYSEVLPDGSQTLSDEPITDMGFFSHEAIGIDPRTGIAYLTEDDFRGDIPNDPNEEVEGPSRSGFLYRFISNTRNLGPGAYLKGGRLQALAVDEMPNYNADLANPGQRFGVVWRDVRPEFAAEDALAKDCARFNRLEGADFSGGAFWFDDTAGGEERLGQIWRLIPGGADDREDGRDGDDRRGRRRRRRDRENFEQSGDILELFFEGQSANNMESPDNLVVAPWGDVWFCEDGSGTDRVMGVAPQGRTYEFARNRLNGSELAGCTFAPDGKTFFVNIQNPGLTFVIWGPFGRVNSRRRRQMAHAAPPPQLAPQVSGELAEAADRYGMSPWEAAAYDRLGVSIA